MIDSKVSTHEFFGVRIVAVDACELTEAVDRLIASGGRSIVSNLNLRALYLMDLDHRLRKFFANSDLVHIDGMSIVWLARCLGHSITREHRVTYIDWLPLLFQRAIERDWRVFYLGSTQTSLDVGLTKLRERFPQLDIRGHHGFLQNPQSDQEAVNAVNECRPHILMVGMGMPLQEHWIINHVSGLDANVVLTTGAAMDYVAGTIPTPPRWAGRVGIEWAFRLAVEPRRLWKRYLVEPILLIGPILREISNRRLRKARKTA